MISITVLLVLTHKSLEVPTFTKKICYEIAGLTSKKFEMRYLDQLNFVPEKLTMELYSVSVHPTKQAFEKQMIYTVTKTTTDCPTEKLDAPYKIDGADYQSLFFVSFYFSDNFMVEHLIIKSGVDGEGEVIGALERGSITVKTSASDKELEKPKSLSELAGDDLPELKDTEGYAITFMSHHSGKAFYITPLPNEKLKLKKILVIDMTLVDSKGERVKKIRRITDLVQIDVVVKTTVTSATAAKLYFSTDLKENKVEFKLFNADGGEVAKSTYPVKAPNGDKAESGSKFHVFGLTPLEWTTPANIATDFNEKSLHFLTTTASTVSNGCSVASKPALFVIHKFSTHTVSSDSRCSKQIGSTTLHYQTKCDAALSSSCTFYA